MQKENHRQLLTKLADCWVRSRPLGLYVPLKCGGINVLDSLLSTITAREPYRSSALEQARLYLTFPLMAGIGLTCEIEPPLTLKPFEQWVQSVSPLRVKLRWSTNMDDDFTESSMEEIHRVVFEEGEWKIVSFWEQHKQAEILKARALF